MIRNILITLGFLAVGIVFGSFLFGLQGCEDQAWMHTACDEGSSLVTAEECDLIGTPKRGPGVTCTINVQPEQKCTCPLPEPTACPEPEPCAPCEACPECETCEVCEPELEVDDCANVPNGVAHGWWKKCEDSYDD